MLTFRDFLQTLLRVDQRLHTFDELLGAQVDLTPWCVTPWRSIDALSSMVGLKVDFDQLFTWKSRLAA
jgi:hypothetical protein